MKLFVTENDNTKRIINVMMIRIAYDTKEIHIWDYNNNHHVVIVEDERYAESCLSNLFENDKASIKGIFLTK